MPVPDNSVIFGFSVGLGVGLCIGFVLKGRLRPRPPPVAGLPESSAGCSESGQTKLILVVRTDLKMGKGKVAAQCAHAAVMAYEHLGRTNAELLEEWRYNGQPKVVTKTDTEESLIQIAEHARSLGLPVSLVRDAGRTQIAPGSKTVLGVGPGDATLIDQVTGHLKLY